jgi:hypothetical protein
MGSGADQNVAFGPVHPLSESILNAESTTRVAPRDILVFVTDDATRAAFDAAFVAEHHVSVFHGRVAICWTAVDALLSFALEANLGINDLNVRTGAIDVEVIQRQFALNSGWIENAGSEVYCHGNACSTLDRSPAFGRFGM